MDSRSTTWSRTTTSTTRPTAREIATAATPTGAGTAASRGRPASTTSLAIRGRQVRNLMATLMLSQGVPMILGGDEFLRTQHGNNNAWCQDNSDQLGRLVARAAERRLPPVRPHDDRLAEGPSRPAAPARFSRASAAACRRKSSGTASSPPSPTFLTRAARWPGPWTAGAPIGPTWSTATSTSR